MVYLDNHATTPVDPQVCAILDNTMRNVFGNPHATWYKSGWDAMDVVEKARSQVAKSIGVFSSNIIFTSGATEANNMVFKGLARPKDRHKILVSCIEHACVRENIQCMQQKGYTVKFIPVDSGGLIDIDALYKLLDENVFLVSVIFVNNEIGTIQNMEMIATMAHGVGALLHSDCAQAFGKVPLDMNAIGIDVLCLSGHKIYGPKGIGALAMTPKFYLEPLLHGGGQERGLRSGTIAPPLIAGFGLASELAHRFYQKENARVRFLRDFLQGALLNANLGFRVLGNTESRIAGNLCLYVEGIDAGSFFSHLENTEISSGSACSSSTSEKSIVLQAIGIDKQREALVLRMCVGRFNSKEDVEIAAKEIIAATHAVKNN